MKVWVCCGQRSSLVPGCFSACSPSHGPRTVHCYILGAQHRARDPVNTRWMNELTTAHKGHASWPEGPEADVGYLSCSLPGFLFLPSLPTPGGSLGPSAVPLAYILRPPPSLISTAPDLVQTVASPTWMFTSILTRLQSP